MTSIDAAIAVSRKRKRKLAFTLGAAGLQREIPRNNHAACAA